MNAPLSASARSVAGGAFGLRRAGLRLRRGWRWLAAGGWAGLRLGGRRAGGGGNAMSGGACAESTAPMPVQSDNRRSKSC